MVERFGMADAKPSPTPMASKHNLSASTPKDHEEAKDLPYQSVTGCLFYGMMATCLEITYTIAQLCKYNSSYTQQHWIVAKHVLCYLLGTQDLCLTYDQSKGLEVNTMMWIPPEILKGFSDADWAGDLDTQCSTSSYVFLLGGGAISWGSKTQTQTSPALSSTEPQYLRPTSPTQ